MATGFNTQVSNGEYRLQFETDNKENYLLMQETARRCVDGKPVTNADRVRSMSDEELAVLLAHETYRMAKPVFDMFGYGITEEFIFAKRLEWLKQTAE